MGIANDDAIKQFHSLMEDADEPLKKTFQNVHQGYPSETYLRFLKARDWNVNKAHKMLMDSLNWRVQNEIDNILVVKCQNLGVLSNMVALVLLWVLSLRRHSPRQGNLLRLIKSCFLLDLKKPIVPAELYREIRDSQLVGMSGYSKEGLPVIAIGVGLSTFDKASVHYYVQSHIQMNEYRDRVLLPFASEKFGRHISTCIKVLDMTGLKLSALNQIKLLTAISTIDDLNYPEKTDTYYIVNVPYIFSACWKVVKPLLQERTRKKIQVLQGCGKDELLKIMDYASLPHFCTREGSGSSRHSRNGTSVNCFSFDHPFHQKLYDYVTEQATLTDSKTPLKQGSFHVAVPDPDPEDAKIAQTIECEFHRLEDRKDKSGLVKSLSQPLSELEIKIN